jgi:hypothetical protein
VKQHDHQETTTVKKPSKSDVKKLRKSSKTIVAKSAARRSLQGAIAADQDRVMSRIRALEQQVAKTSGQDSWAAAYPLAKARMELAALAQVRKAAMPDMNSAAAVDRYLSAPNATPAAAAARVNQTAQNRAIAGALGDPIGQHLGRKTSLDVMNDVLNGTGQAEQVRDFEAQAQKFAKALKEADSPQAREAAAFGETRARLMLGHLRGEI